ncbi:opioid growth factor receptor-like protein 1 [Liolophura sinensis]|uniref:opioid growth factor receptor-like protein 1 n=1 Tax=Liolophura sinensis TaxID=3198878 RepID=UPI0031588A8D
MSNSRIKSPKQPGIEQYFSKSETRENRASGSDKILSSRSSGPSSGFNSHQHSLVDKRRRQHTDHTKHRRTADHTKMGLIFGKPDDETDCMMKFMRDKSARDLEKYRKSYPGKVDDPEQTDNYLFYTNQLVCKPDGGLIDEIHEKWWGDYERLEMHHGYIQWLFPIREIGMNWHSQELQLHEVEKILADEKAKERFLKSYKMMLDFYGMKLKDEETGEVCRSENWEDRFKHLNSSVHNYLRITRILKCLGELGLEHYKYPVVSFLIEEAGFHRTLRNTLESCIMYWIETVKDGKQREDLRLHVKRYTRKPVQL